MSQLSNPIFNYLTKVNFSTQPVEIWFGILSRKLLRNASFANVESLGKAIEGFVSVYHQGARPFVWRKREVKGAQLRNTIANLIQLDGRCSPHVGEANIDPSKELLVVFIHRVLNAP